MKPLLCCVFALFQCSLLSAQQLQTEGVLRFIENKGQVRDQHGCVRDDIDYQLKAMPGLNVFIGNGKINYQFSKVKNTMPLPEPYTVCGGIREEGYEMYRLDVSLKGANPLAVVVAENVLSYYEQYHTSAFNGIVHTYGKITYRNIYPHIDWVLYDKDGHLEYDFVVRPGGNVKDIQIQYDGATELIARDGYVTAVTPMGIITEKALHSYIAGSKTDVRSGYVCNDHTISFDVADHNGTLVIDPTLEWATYFGGENNEALCRITADNAGHIYMSGSTRSVTAIATTGAYQTIHGGGVDDMFLARFTTGGNLLWSTYYGGSGTDASRGHIAIDNAGDIYITGWTWSPDGIATSGAHQPTYGGGQDAFIAKFSSSGTFIWGTYFGAAGGEEGCDIFCDVAGNIYLAGSTGSMSGIASTGAHDAVLSGASDAFVAKFTGSGSLVWATYFGGGDIENGYRIRSDIAGNVYLCGTTRSTDAIATPGAHNTALGAVGFSDAFLAKFRNDGALLWSTYYGGAAAEETVLGLDCDSSMNVYISGNTRSTDSIATPGCHQGVLLGMSDVFLAKFNGDGSLLWGTYYGGYGYEFPADLYCSGSGIIGMVGGTTSFENIATATGVKTYRSSGTSIQDAFLSLFATSGSLLWATYFGSGETESGDGITSDDSGYYYMCGQERSLDSIATVGAFQPVFGGGASDCFLVKYRLDSIAAPADTVYAPDDDFDGHALAVTDIPVIEVTLYPNPVSGILRISYGNSVHVSGEALITDVTGKVLLECKLHITHGSAIVDMSGLRTGTYFLKLYSDGVLIKNTKVTVAR